jgi:hypothetical protein
MPAFDGSNRGNAYRIYLEMQTEAFDQCFKQRHQSQTSYYYMSFSYIICYHEAIKQVQ